MHTLEQKLLYEISKMEAITFLGLARYLKLDLLKENEDPKTFADLLEEVMEIIKKMNRAQKKQILRLVQNANRAEVSEEK
jgi:hypothetical protein